MFVIITFIYYFCLCMFYFFSITKILDNNFINFEIPNRYNIEKTSIKKIYQDSYESVWNNALIILVQNALVLRTYRNSGIIFYLDIDGVYFDKRFYNMEFPFSILINKEIQEKDYMCIQ